MYDLGTQQREKLRLPRQREVKGSSLEKVLMGGRIVSQGKAGAMARRARTQWGCGTQGPETLQGWEELSLKIQVQRPVGLTLSGLMLPSTKPMQTLDKA